MRRIVSITGTRADYGLMAPVHRALADNKNFELHLIVTGMHHLPNSLPVSRKCAPTSSARCTRPSSAWRRYGESDGAGSRGCIVGTADLLDKIKRTSCCCRATAARCWPARRRGAHEHDRVHMSGGDFSGSIDDSIRNAISKLAHFHLTTCDASTRRLLDMAERRERIVEVGEPALDLLRTMDFVPLETLADELDLPAGKPYLIATLHPVTDEASRRRRPDDHHAGSARELDMPTIVTYRTTMPAAAPCATCWRRGAGGRFSASLPISARSVISACCAMLRHGR